MSSDGSSGSSTYTQKNRPLQVTTPLATDALLLETFEGAEALSSPFTFRLGMLAASGTTIDFSKLLGGSITVSLQLDSSTTRYFNGIGARVTKIDSGRGENVSFDRYAMDVVPSLWNLTRVAQSRTFQQQTVVQILQAVLTGLTLDVSKLTVTYPTRDYCVQYRETDFAFASRLMEEEGIFYFFTHANGSHTMVLGDGATAFPAISGSQTYRRDADQAPDEEWVTSWRKTQEVRSGKYTLWDHSFELPTSNLQATQTGLSTVQAGTVSQSLAVGGNSGFEIYDYPGEYAKRFAGVSPAGQAQTSVLNKVFDDNTRTVKLRMDRETVAGLEVVGSSTCRALAAGSTFTLAGHPDSNGSWALTQVTHEASLEGSYRASSRSQKFGYTNTFRCIPAALPFRPERTTPRPKIGGVQTAVVVGDSGKEIQTDQYGRVKVQFFWDRLGQDNANSSCWVRVATPWAGKQWGMIHIPRIGQEVLVDFLEGDPDRPVIVGSLYNADQMPPNTLPDNMTQSGIRSRSTLQGDSTNFNELRFEDKKGSEQVYFHAEKDFVREVENNDSLTVGSSNTQTCADGSQTITIYKDRTETVQTGNESVTISKGNRSITVSQGNDSHTISQGTRTVTVQKDDSLTINQGNRSMTVSAGKETVSLAKGRSVSITEGGDSLTVSAGDHTITVSSGGSTISAATSITLKVGANSITISTSGISIQAAMVSITGNSTVTIKGSAGVMIN